MLIGHAVSLVKRTGGETSDPAAPPILAHLAGLTNGEARDGTTIGVTLTNAPAGSPVSYQWQQDGIDIPGATEASEAVEIGVTHGDNGALRCVVTVDGVSHLTGSAPMRHAPGALSIPTPPTWIVDDTLVSLQASGAGASLTFSNFRLSGLPHLSMDPATGLITGSITLPDYQIQPAGTGTVTAEDQYGRTYSITFAWTTDLRAKATVLTSLVDRFWTVDDDTVDLDLSSAFAANGNTLTFTVSGLPTGLLDDGDGSISGTPSVDGQVGTVSITAIDEYARETTTAFSGTTAYRGQATAAGALGPFTWTVEEPIVTEDAAHDFTTNDNLLTYSASGLPAGVVIDPVTAAISGTPASAGSGAVLITASDEYGRQTSSATSQTTALRPPATAAGALAPRVFTVGDPVDLDLSVDFTANGNSLSFAITGLADGLQDDGDGSISGTPTVGGQTGTITITATDAYGRTTISTLSYSTSSAQPAQATAAGALGPFAWTVDDTSIDVDAASDFTAQGNSLTYTATGLPQGVTIAPGGRITGTPSAASDGAITITATDTYGRVTTSTTSHTTALRAPATSAGTLPDQTFTVGETVDLSLAGDFNAQGNSLSYAISGLPTGLVDDGDGTLSGSASVAGQSGSATVTATDEYGRQTASGFGYTTQESIFALTEEGDWTISVTWTGTLDSLTIGGGGTFDGTYTQFHDGTALIDTHLDAVAGRALAILATTGATTIGSTLTAGGILVLHQGTAEPAVTIQWQRDGVDVLGATGPTYTLATEDAGADVRPTFRLTLAGRTTVTETGSAIPVDPANVDPDPDPSADPEAGLTLTRTVSHGTTITGSDVSKTPPVLFAVDFTGLTTGTDGMIWEHGANAVGASLSVEGTDIVLRAGDGGAKWPGGCAYIVAPCPIGDGTLVWEINAGSVRMWWNGVSLGTATGSFSGNYAGADDGMFFGVHNVRTAGSPGSGFTGFTTASDVRYYENQTSSL